MCGNTQQSVSDSLAETRVHRESDHQRRDTSRYAYHCQ